MKPLQIGITGGIGSGKSVVCRILTVLGIPVYNADEESKKLLDGNSEVVARVIRLLGPGAYLQSGKADRAYIAGVVFNNPKQLQELNAILHPAVQQHYRTWVTNRGSVPLVAKEAAIMFESGSYLDMDFVVAVIAPDELRIRRVTERDGKSPDQVNKIIHQQLSQDEVIKRSDFVIVNDEHQLVIPQVLNIVDKLKNSSN